MYDFPGTEGNGEHDWIEVKNDGTESVDLSKFKFFENGTNHGLKLDRGSALVPAGGIAVIANATSTFLSDYPQFSGALFDSSFSLVGTVAGETLIIRNSELVDEDAVAYLPEWGAKDDGNSLQKIDGVWKAATPTPGLSNVSAENGNPPDTSTDTSLATTTSTDTNTQGRNESSANTNSGGSNWPVDPQIFAKISGPKSAIAGADIEFGGEAVGVEKKPLVNERYSWNFGDGEMKEGQSVLHAFNYPGNYVVVLNVSSGHYVGSDRVVLKVIDADVTISKIEPGILGMVEIENKTGEELDLSWWIFQSGNNFFTLPKDTIILPKGKLPFSSKVTKLNILPDDAKLLYPNGMIAASFNHEQKPLPAVQAVTNQIGETQSQKPVSVTSAKSVVLAEKGDSASVKKIAEDNANEAQTASAVLSVANNAEKQSETGWLPNYKWILAVLALVGVCVFAVLSFWKKEAEESEKFKEDFGDIKIIESDNSDGEEPI